MFDVNHMLVLNEYITTNVQMPMYIKVLTQHKSLESLFIRRENLVMHPGSAVWPLADSADDCSTLHCIYT